MSSDEFYEKFEKGELGDSQEFMLWAAEYETLKVLKKDKKRMLRSCERGST